MNTVRPFKFVKITDCDESVNHIPVVAMGDDEGLNIAQLVEKYQEDLYGSDISALEALQDLVGRLETYEAAQPIAVDDHHIIKLHHSKKCALLQCVNGKVVVTDNTGREHLVTKGESLLIPAATTLVAIDGTGDVLITDF